MVLRTKMIMQVDGGMLYFQVVVGGDVDSGIVDHRCHGSCW